jgi:hypothetical protein
MHFSCAIQFLFVCSKFPLTVFVLSPYVNTVLRFPSFLNGAFCYRSVSCNFSEFLSNSSNAASEKIQTAATVLKATIFTQDVVGCISFSITLKFCCSSSWVNSSSDSFVYPRVTFSPLSDAPWTYVQALQRSIWLSIPSAVSRIHQSENERFST